MYSIYACSDDSRSRDVKGQIRVEGTAAQLPTSSSCGLRSRRSGADSCMNSGPHFVHAPSTVSPLDRERDRP